MMNSHRGFKRDRSWDQSESSSFGPPKQRRVDNQGAMSHPGGQQYHSQGHQGFHGEQSGNSSHQGQDTFQGAGNRGGFGDGARRAGSRRGGGGRGRGAGQGSLMLTATSSVISRLMNMASSDDVGSGNDGSGSNDGGSGINSGRSNDDASSIERGGARGNRTRGRGRGASSSVGRPMDLQSDSSSERQAGFSNNEGSFNQSGRGRGFSQKGRGQGGFKHQGQGQGFRQQTQVQGGFSQQGQGQGGFSQQGQGQRGCRQQGQGGFSRQGQGQGGFSQQGQGQRGFSQHVQGGFSWQGQGQGGFSQQGQGGFSQQGQGQGGFQQHGQGQRGSSQHGGGQRGDGQRGGRDRFEGGGTHRPSQMVRDPASTINRLMDMASGGDDESGFQRGRGGKPRGTNRGSGSTIKRIMDIASCSRSGSQSVDSMIGGDSGHDRYNEHRGQDGSRGMHNQGVRGRGARGGRSFSHSGTPHGRGIGYETSAQFGQEQNQIRYDQRGRGGAQFNQHQHGEQAGFKPTGGGQDAFSHHGQRAGADRSGQAVLGGGHSATPRDLGDRVDHRGGSWQVLEAPEDGKFFTRPDGTAVRRQEYSILDYSSKFEKNTLPLEDRFINLCKEAIPLLDNMPRRILAPQTLEKMVFSDNVCLTPTYVIKGERLEKSQSFKSCKVLTCRIYLENIFLATGQAEGPRKAKNVACRNAIHLLATKNAKDILATHQKVNVKELGKEEADIIECPLRASESNIGILMGVPESNEKKSLSDFYIKEPEVVTEKMCNNATGILKQSADFSKLLLTYEFTTSNQGVQCSVKMEGKTLATSTASIQNNAKNLASEAALQKLRQTNWTIKVINRDKPRPAPEPLTASMGRIHDKNPNSRVYFMQNLTAYFEKFFGELDDDTKWLSLSQELNPEECEAVHEVAKEMNLRVEQRRLDGARGKIGKNEPVFLLVSKKLLGQDLFDYIFEQGGETWRFRLKPPGEMESA